MRSIEEQEMIRNVLFVDDDQEMLQALKEGLEKYRDTFQARLASDGTEAVSHLKQHAISLVVTDLKMPGMDGFSLLAHIMENYPDIPVIIITGYSTSEMKRLAQEGGAVGYISKPFLIEDLAKHIMKTLRKESDGGTLHGVSSGMFLQLMEMEERTCTIRLTDRASAKSGVLFFRDGELLNARVDEQQGLEAAYVIFSWEEVTLSIQNECPQKDNKINSDLQPIILEAMRIKDEAEDSSDDDDADEAETIDTLEVEETIDSPLETIKNLLKEQVGERCGLEDIYQDNSMAEVLRTVSDLGAVLQMGRLKVGYLDRDEDNDMVLLPGEPATIILVNPKCPRDKIIQVLNENK
jgi:CheY-like chemotaxis protein